MMEMVMMRRSNGNVECHHWNPDTIRSTLPIISGAGSVEVRPVETGYIPPVDDVVPPDETGRWMVGLEGIGRLDFGSYVLAGLPQI